MHDQLLLVEAPGAVPSPPVAPAADLAWVLDERTRDVGRRGLVQAREALRRAARAA